MEDGGPSEFANQLISDSNSGLYMWESAENQIEFENDLIASTNANMYSNKELMKYESTYYREPVMRP